MQRDIRQVLDKVYADEDSDYGLELEAFNGKNWVKSESNENVSYIVSEMSCIERGAN